VAVAVSEVPHPAQKFVPGAFWCPQLVQKLGAGVAAAAVAGTRVLCPQFVQNALSAGTSVRQAGQG